MSDIEVGKGGDQIATQVSAHRHRRPTPWATVRRGAEESTGFLSAGSEYSSDRPQPVAAVAGLGERVRSEAQETLAGHQLVQHDGQTLLIDNFVQVVDLLGALVTDEAVVGEGRRSVHDRGGYPDDTTAEVGSRMVEDGDSVPEVGLSPNPKKTT